MNDGAPVLLRNTVGRQNHWLGVNLVGKKSNPDAIGARITYQSGDLKQQRMKVGGGSFLSAHDPRIVLGVGKRAKIDWLEINGPNQVARSSGLSTYRSTVTSRLSKALANGSKWQEQPRSGTCCNSPLELHAARDAWDAVFLPTVNGSPMSQRHEPSG